MKVIYKKSIIDKLVDATEDARLSGKEIEKIVLTRVEVYELQRFYSFNTSSYGGVFNGVPIEVEGK